MIRKCKHIETGRIGKIIEEMKGNEKFPDQYGIYWEGSFSLNEKILNYWQDQDKIEIL